MRNDPFLEAELRRSLSNCLDAFDGSSEQRDSLLSLVLRCVPHRIPARPMLDAFHLLHFWDPLKEVLSPEILCLRRCSKMTLFRELGNLLAFSFSCVESRASLTSTILAFSHEFPMGLPTILMAEQCRDQDIPFSHYLHETTTEFLDNSRQTSSLVAVEFLGQLSRSILCVEGCYAIAHWIDYPSCSKDGASIVDEILDWSVKQVACGVVATMNDGAMKGGIFPQVGLDKATSKADALDWLTSLRPLHLGQNATELERRCALVLGWVRVALFIDACTPIFIEAIEGLVRAMFLFQPSLGMESMLSLVTRIRPTVLSQRDLVVIEQGSNLLSLVHKEGELLVENSGNFNLIFGLLQGRTEADLQMLRSALGGGCAETARMVSDEILVQKSSGLPTSYTRDRVCGQFTVCLSHERSLGDNLVIATIRLTDRGSTVATFLDPTLSLLAMHRTEPAVFEQAADGETTEIRLDTGQRQLVAAPLRQELVLFSEALAGRVDRFSTAPLGMGDPLPPFQFGIAGPNFPACVSNLL